MIANEWAEFLPKLHQWHIGLLVLGITEGDHRDFCEMARTGFVLETNPMGLLIRGPFSKFELSPILARRAELREQRDRIDAELKSLGG